MKKLLLSVLALAAFTTAEAQLTLTASPYTQNFNTLGTALPTGWGCYKSSTSSSLGTLDVYSTSATFGAYYDTTACASSVFGHGFKNCASAASVNSTASCATQTASTNRALGVRQTSGTGSYPGYDPGAAFVLHLANTTGYASFNMTFKLQSLDIRSSRSTVWTVDYGLGATPTAFIPTTPTGYLTTGGNVFSDTTITVNFGAALNNQSQDVWIRVAALAGTTGSGSRTTTAIDDVTLTYTPFTGINDLSANPQVSFTVLGEATADKTTLRYNVEKAGLYNLNIYDMAGREVYSRQMELNSGTQSETISGLNILPGMYIARLGNGASLSTAKLIIQ